MWEGLSVWRGEWLRVWEELSVGGGRGAACVGVVSGCVCERG